MTKSQKPQTNRQEKKDQGIGMWNRNYCPKRTIYKN